jgi:hypothetical protein
MIQVALVPINLEDAQRQRHHEEDRDCDSFAAATDEAQGVVAPKEHPLLPDRCRYSSTPPPGGAISS